MAREDETVVKIGIVTTWFERGASYVSRIYMDMLVKEGHEVFIYSRGGQKPSRDSAKWNEDYVTRDDTFQNSRVNTKKFFAWLKEKQIEAVLFNEQQDFRIVGETKKAFPNVKLAAYVDYYTESTIPWFELYDFLICNTHRHMQAMEKHPQKHYVRWGTDLTVYKPTYENRDQLTFFHSVGMSTRKGTDLLIDAFLDGECYKRSKLIIHTQIPISAVTQYSKEFLQEKNVEVIQKTVTAPGLYHKGDIYVYPTRLDGLGLTMYEAAACGMPIITTDFPPMNEAVKPDFGRLVKVKDYYCRQDAYYFPMAICDKADLVACMQWYIDYPERVVAQKKNAREYAEQNYDIMRKSVEVSSIFMNSSIRPLNDKVYHDMMHYYKKETNSFHLFTENRTCIYKLKCRLIKALRR